VTPTQKAISYGIRNYQLGWFTRLTKGEREKVIKAYVAGLRSGKR
jgi:hypothetical protein